MQHLHFVKFRGILDGFYETNLPGFIARKGLTFLKVFIYMDGIIQGACHLAKTMLVF